MLGYLALILLPVAAVVYVIWAHRRRESQRAAASSKRFAQMFGAVSGTSPATAPSSSSPAPAAAPAAKATIPLCTRKQSILDARHAVLYHQLTAALAEFRIFPHMSLAAVVQLPATLPGRDREQRMRVLAQSAIDCVICSEAMEVVAAVDLEDGRTAESRIKSEYLCAAGIPYLRINPAQAADVEGMRKLVLRECISA